MKRRLLDLQDKYEIKKRRVTTSFTEAVELIREFLWPTNVLINTVPSSEVLVTTGEDITQISGQFDRSESCIAKLDSIETVTIIRHKHLLFEVEHFYAEGIGV